MDEFKFFEIWFQLSVKGKKEQITVTGGWSEDRPLPNSGEIIYLNHPDLGKHIHSTKVLNVASFYSPSNNQMSFGGNQPIPYFAKLVVVIGEAEPLTTEEEKKFPALRLVEPQAH